MILRKATNADRAVIWKILQEAVEQRRKDGSAQWQDGYPNEKTVEADTANGYGYVLTAADEVIAYAAVIFDTEPAYEAIEGKWLTNRPYVVIHRVAVTDTVKGKGVATQLFLLIEKLAVAQQIFSIKVDTNFDNQPMLRILDKLGYTYCGEVFFRGAARKAFEKKLDE